MKKVLALVLALLLLSVPALATPRTIDLETMTVEELTSLKSEVAAAISVASSAMVDGYVELTDYGEYARNPVPHKGEKIRFNGTVEQVSEGIEATTYRIAVRGNTSNIFYVTYELPVEADRVLENDDVTVTGIFEGLIDYTGVLGTKITVPALTADKIIDEIIEVGEYAATRQEPAPIGATIRYSGDDWNNKSETDVTVTNIIRGGAAWETVRKWNRYNDKPGANEEYVIAYVKTAVITSPDDKPVEFSHYNFTFVSATGAAYDSSYVSGVTPELKDLYPGAENEGALVTLVPKDDKPMLVYLQKSDSPLWFDLNNRLPIKLDESIVLTTLQKGDKNDDVKNMQLMLVQLGYLSGTPDGDFGNKTKEAVIKYQGDMGLEATGIADEATLRLILTAQGSTK